MVDNINQRQKILDYLDKHDYLTSFTAYSELKITQFATRISELEERGYEFEKVWDYNINSRGEKKRFKKYHLINGMEMANMNHIPNIL